MFDSLLSERKRPNSTHPTSAEMFHLFMRCVPLVLFSHLIILNIILFKKSCNSKNVSFSSLWYFKKVHSIQQHIFRKCMLISYEIAEGAQLKTGTLKRSFVVQNKLHGPQNNECRRAKCISKKRGDITTVKNVLSRLENNQCSGWFVHTRRAMAVLWHQIG